MGDKLRLFVGVRLSVAAVQELADVARGMKRAADAEGVAVKWVAPACYHMTLKFLGWTREPVLEAISDRVRRALSGATALELDARGVGAFPKPTRARVLWAGVDDPEGRLADLAARVDEATAELGFAPETRPFHPHVTLGRIKRPADASGMLDPFAEQAYSSTWVDSVVLFQSIMKSNGSEYVHRASWPLERAGSGRKRQTRDVERGPKPGAAGPASTEHQEHDDGPEQGIKRDD